MNTCPLEDLPSDTLSQISAKIAFLGDAIAQPGKPRETFVLSEDGQFGLLLILRGLRDEIRAVETQLLEAEKEEGK